MFAKRTRPSKSRNRPLSRVHDTKGSKSPHCDSEQQGEASTRNSRRRKILPTCWATTSDNDGLIRVFEAFLLVLLFAENMLLLSMVHERGDVAPRE
jgi:hypothetical protein